MSLDWDATGVKDRDRYDSRAWEAAVFQAMFVGVGNLDERGVIEYAIRVRILEELGQGVYLKDEDGKTVSAWTNEALLGLQGLRVNVSFETRPKWLKRQLELRFRTIERDMLKLRDELKQAVDA